MADKKSLSKVTAETDVTPPWIPTDEERIAQMQVLKDYVDGRLALNKSYAQFNDRALYDAIDDWTKRWNGYVPPADALIDPDQSRMFLNFTRNQIISYLAKIALQRPKAHIKAVNKKTGIPDKKLAEVIENLNQFSLDEENGEARFLEVCIECTTKGTVIVYEGYRRQTQEAKSIAKYNAETGKVEFGDEETRVIFDNCFQQVVPLEDFFIANPYEPDLQKQPFVIWRQITTHSEASATFSKYPNWKYVKPGAYVVATDPSTFYRNKVITDLSKTQVEIVRYYNRKKNNHVIMVNGVILYDSVIPFKDGRYPFAKGIFEPFEVNFFWGMGFPQKIMGEQDLMNTFWNMMADKTFGSLLPYGLSSDLDDLIEDDVLQPNKIRKVSDINKWKFDSLPSVNAAEQGMMEMAIQFARENSGLDMTGVVNAQTSKGGKVSARQALMKQQEAMQRLGFSMNYMEDFEVDRTRLRISHILQFYSVPRIEKVTNEKGKEIEKLLYRDIRLDDVKLSSGKTGTKIIKLIDTIKNPDEKKKMQDDMALEEAKGELRGQPTQVLALNINTFGDFNLDVVVVRNSSYKSNQVLEQASRMEYMMMRMQMMQAGVPADMKELVDWVGESYDIDTSRFEPKPQAQGMMGQPQPTENPASNRPRASR